MELAQILSSLDAGNFETLLQAIEMMGFQDVGLEIPLEYGLSIIIYVTKENVAELAHTELERYSFEKLYSKGGAIRVDIKWADTVNLIRGVLYYNFRIGLVLILEGIIEAIPQTLLRAIFYSLTKMVQFNKNNQTVDIIEMRNFIVWFDNIYYTGILETGKDRRFIGNILNFKR